MRIRVENTRTPDDRIFILQCFQNDIITKEEARALLFVEE